MTQATVILVDGIDGSGKTVFAQRWADAVKQAGTRVTLLQVDGFRREVDWSDPRGEAEVYWSDYFDLAALEARLAGETEAGGLILVEGIFTLRLARAQNCPLVYLEAELEECIRRILVRDTAKGRSLDDVQHRMSARYFPAQERYRKTYRPLERAGVLVNNTRPESPRLLRADWTGFTPEARDTLTTLIK